MDAGILGCSASRLQALFAIVLTPICRSTERILQAIPPHKGPLRAEKFRLAPSDVAENCHSRRLTRRELGVRQTGQKRLIYPALPSERAPTRVLAPSPLLRPPPRTRATRIGAHTLLPRAGHSLAPVFFEGGRDGKIAKNHDPEGPPKLSEFGRLVDELSVAAARPQATTYSRSPPARPLPALRTRADPNFAKSLDAGLTQAEGRIGKHAITMALNSNEDRLADIRSRARQAI